MNYFETIRELTKSIPASIVDFSIERVRTSPPTQASSNFITNKEQGDWAELLIFRAINETFEGFVAVRYGKSDDLVAGEKGFDTFYNEFQDELDTIGKRPDLLIFKKEDFREDLGDDISKLEHSTIEDYVKLAVAGLEVRSSAFLIDKYEALMQHRTQTSLEKAFEIKAKIIDEYSDILSHPKKKKYLDILSRVNASTPKDKNLLKDFRRPGWRKPNLQKVRKLLSALKDCLEPLFKRDYLSITPKVEDLKVVYKWIEKFNVPHFYVQVFLDKAYGISYKDILTLISKPDKKGEYYRIERDSKNQMKTTIKISTKQTTLVANNVDTPKHESKEKELNRGRVLYFVSFKKEGTAYLDVDSIKQLLNIQNA